MQQGKHGRPSLDLLGETLYFMQNNIYPHHYCCCVLPQLMDAKLIIIYFFGYSEIFEMNVE